MTNAEKYKEELRKLHTKTDFATWADENGVRFGGSIYCGGSNGIIKWLLAEYVEPIKLSKLEYDILKYLSDNTRHMYITRDGNGIIFLYDVEPEKSNSAPWWTGRGMCHMSMFNKLFQFVQWEDSEPTSIQEVLENCEVVEDAEE